MRAFRATRQTAVQQVEKKVVEKSQPKETTQPATKLGETLFGVKPVANAQANPFASGPSNGTSANPFSAGGASSNPFASTSSLAAKPPQKAEDEAASLPETFAQKARISDTQPAQPAPKTSTSKEPWPTISTFPHPFLQYHLDADTEYIESEPTPGPSSSNVRMDTEGGADIDKTLFESTMDKTFQRFADRLAQNPEQVLRYDFGGQPLLYSKSDKVGKCFAEENAQENAKVKVQGSSSGAKIPRCGNCGGARVFELQLTPHAITELEAEDMSIDDGMDWGTILLDSCGRDCQEAGKGSGEVGYVEEWAGVQWEELASAKRPA